MTSEEIVSSNSNRPNMSSPLSGATPHSSLPTLSKLRSTVASDICAADIAKQWLDSFSNAIRTEDTSALNKLFVEDAAWRDLLAFTWDYRSIQGLTRITALFKDRVLTSDLQVSSLAISQDTHLSPTLSKPFPDLDLFWIQFGFGFDTALGRCMGIVRLLPLPDGTWKAYTVFTALQSLWATKASSPLFSVFANETDTNIVLPHRSHIGSINRNLLRDPLHRKERGMNAVDVRWTLQMVTLPSS